MIIKNQIKPKEIKYNQVGPAYKIGVKSEFKSKLNRSLDSSSSELFDET